MITDRITDRIDAITGIPPEYRHAILPAPKSVKIELTSQCNYRCGFCAHRLRMKERGGMDREFSIRIFDNERKFGGRIHSKGVHGSRSGFAEIQHEQCRPGTIRESCRGQIQIMGSIAHESQKYLLGSRAK